VALAIIYSRANKGLTAPQVIVEVHISGGLPSLHIVGLPEAAVKESKDRVRSAILNARFNFPTSRITVNLAPADLPKEGGRFDLPIAIGILAASGQIPQNELDQYEFAAELALSGQLRAVVGMLPFSIASSQNQKRTLLAIGNCEEAALPSAAKVYGANHLLDVSRHFITEHKLPRYQLKKKPKTQNDQLDLKDIIGQYQAKRALEIAAAGQHSLLMVGPPGTGKTMLASRLPGILPEMTEQQALELSAILSISGKGIDLTKWRQRPFRAPHHTASSAALVGGGSPPRPGEITLAHEGVLFLDELPEFKRSVLEAMREPLESGRVTISRAAHQTEFPARFQLVAAMNPCPCGYLGDLVNECECSPQQVKRYQLKISGPILDRIDLHLQVPRLPKGMISNGSSQKIETSQQVRLRVNQARAIQLKRSQHPNAILDNQGLKTYCKLGGAQKKHLEEAVERLALSARGYHSVIRVARTIADLNNKQDIHSSHLSEALAFRDWSLG